MDKQKILEAGKIASEAKKYARTIVKKGVPLLEIAEKIEAKIIELGGKPAFPVNLSINEIAAHYTPNHDDKTTAHGLIKVDLGVHIEGWVADTSFSLDLENNEENKRLIVASEEALEKALNLIKSRFENNKSNDKSSSPINNSDRVGGWDENSNEVSLNEIGSTIQEKIESHKFSPVINLCGHSIDHYELHAGVTIPNVDNGVELKLKEGLYAVEPFATTGTGKVHDGAPSGIYYLMNKKSVRSPIAREVLNFIEEEYDTLPFCSRWIVKKLYLVFVNLKAQEFYITSHS